MMSTTPTKSHPNDDINEGDCSNDTSSDHLLAQMLQLEFDREHDQQLRVEERHFNQHNKGKETQPSLTIT